MRIDNKGFAISSMLYSILLLFLMLVLGVLGVLGNRKIILDKIKSEVITNLTQNKAYDFSFEHKNILLANTSKVSNFSFTLLDGVKVIDQNGNVVETEIKTTSSPAFDSTKNGIYIITYEATYEGVLLEEERIIEVIDPIVYTYAYTGKEQAFTAPVSGVYRTQLWGGSGMVQTEQGKAGKGGYVSGDILLTFNTNLHVYVGGSSNWGDAFNAVAGSVNGFTGGGATDVRLAGGSWDQFESLKSRIMVAGGGGGSEWPYAIGGDAGGLIGSIGYGTDWSATSTQIKATGGTQTSGGISEDSTAGNNGGFGVAGYNITSTDYGGMGGGGYYGGASKDAAHAGGGGSSFISGHTGCNAILENSTQNNIVHSNQPNHYSGYVFTNTVMKAGNEEMPTHDEAGVMIGNEGNGYAKITALIIDNGKVATNLVQNSGFEEDENIFPSGYNSVSTLTTDASLSGKRSLLIMPSNVASANQSAYVDSTTRYNYQTGHQYYYSAYFISSMKSALTFYSASKWGNVGPHIRDYFDESTEWKQISIIIPSTASTQSADDIIIRLEVNSSLKNEPSYFDNILLLDLTEIYGAGNEPTKEWCDQNIQYFDVRGIVPSR